MNTNDLDTENCFFHGSIFLYVSSGWLELDMGAYWLLSRGGRKAVSLKGGFVI